MPWASLSLWLILEACGQVEGGGYGPAPSYDRFLIRRDSVVAIGEEVRPGSKRCSWIVTSGDRPLLVKGGWHELSCRVAPRLPQCNQRDAKDAAP